MFCCVFEDYFGLGETCETAYRQLLENVEFALEDTDIEPDSCKFFAKVEVNISEKTEYQIDPDWDSL